MYFAYLCASCVLCVLRTGVFFVYVVCFCFVFGSRFRCVLLALVLSFFLLFFAHIQPPGICIITPCRRRCWCRYRCPTIGHPKCLSGDRGRSIYWSNDLDVDPQSRIVKRDLDLRRSEKSRSESAIRSRSPTLLLILSYVLLHGLKPKGTCRCVRSSASTASGGIFATRPQNGNRRCPRSIQIAYLRLRRGR